MGNIHPRFWGWYMGASNFTGALGDFFAAAEGSNLGGGNTCAAQVEQQTLDWLTRLAKGNRWLSQKRQRHPDKRRLDGEFGCAYGHPQPCSRV